MPHLTWDTKAPAHPPSAEIRLEAVIYPQGKGYPRDEPGLSREDRETGRTQERDLSSTLTSNALYLGDNLAVMAALLPTYEERIQLIYADPPFFTNRRYPARVGRGEDSRRPQEWQLAEGYPDYWPDLDAYLDMLYPRLQLMHRLLAPTGTLYLHLDWHADAYARVLMDEIFGPDRLLNQIAWVYHGPSPIRSAFNRKHDTILVYTKGKEYTFNVEAVREPYNPNTRKTFASSPRAGFGKVPDLERGKVPEDWWYFPVVARLHRERTGYPTQKPQALLERILLASSNPGDLVADFFCGSGTTPCVAARLGRIFMANDLTWRAVHTTRTRLVELPSEPFATYCVKKEPNAGNASPDHPTPRPPDPRASPAPDLPNIRLSGRCLQLPEALRADLDYWEADPAWDGQVFHSAAQATRPRRGQLIPDRLYLPVVPAGRPIAVRLVFVNGESQQIILNQPTAHL
jgi:DNA modification methylase